MTQTGLDEPTTPQRPVVKLELSKEEERLRDSAFKDRRNSGTDAKARWRKAPRNLVVGLGVAHSPSVGEMCGVAEIEVHELRTLQQLGEGTYAHVEQCLYAPQSGDTPQLVAVKKLKPNVVAQPEDMAAFMSEVAVLRKLQHRHIMNYIGIGSVDNSSEALRQSSMFLVVELMEGGTLKRLVMKQMTAPHSCLYSHGDALRWCTQIASALDYMHTASPMVIHRDLKLDNILLKGKATICQEAKLADLGLTVFINKKQQSARVLLPPPPAQGVTRSTSSREARQLHKLWRSRSLTLMKASPSDPALARSPCTPTSPPAGAADAPPEPGKVSLRTSLDSLTQSLRSSFRSQGSLKASFRKLSQQLFHSDSARQMHEDQEQGRGLGPSKLQTTGRAESLMYMAPEMLRNEQYNEKVDVFSFGMVMYELLHKYMMVFAVSVQGTEEEIKQYAERVAGGWRPPINKDFPPEVRSLITDMWAQDANTRPSMSEVVRRLKHIQHKYTRQLDQDKGQGQDQAAGDLQEQASSGPGCIIS